ncbi:cysteine hydrolase family protein [Noviherbaspirillum sp. ST9]|uniref:cysteine hydrolase family protein n=1 Tax=Noviherbaspirillum sp. ST9 TaxID=3401606 RepID=UPI003B5884F0
MTRSAILLMDLQHDFLGAPGGRMPVESDSVAPIIDTANAILGKAMLKDALPVMVVNRFPEADRIGNFFRRGAAVAGTQGAELDARIRSTGPVKVIEKASASAFTNPELDRYLRAESISDVYVMGVFAEGCVRATVLDARRRGYVVHVLADAVASNASWKKRFGLWTMRRAGAHVLASSAVR